METEKDEEEEAELAAEVAPDILSSLWDDGDTNAFYENLPHLVDIPSILYKDSKAEVKQEAKMRQQQEKSLEVESEDEIQINKEPVEDVNVNNEYE